MAKKKSTQEQTKSLAVDIAVDEGRIPIRHISVPTTVKHLLSVLADHPKVYQRNGQLLLEQGGELIQLQDGHCAAILGEQVQLYTGVGDDRKPIEITHTMHKQVFKRSKWEGVRDVEMITNYPCFRADGTITQPGYDPELRLLYIPTSDEFASLNEIALDPELDDLHAIAKGHVETIRDIFCDFPFADQEGFATTLALLMTPLFVGMNDPKPAFAIDAPTQGSGKSLIAQLVSIILTGQDIIIKAWPRDPETQRKVLSTSVLSPSGPLFCGDNCDYIGGEAIEALITSTIWGERQMQTYSEVSAKINKTYVWTGNRISYSADMTRRVLEIRLISNVEDPSQRKDFKHGHEFKLKNHARRNRFELIRSLVEIIYCYQLAKASGRLVVNPRSFGTFGEWRECVAAPILWATGCDPITTNSRIKEQAGHRIEDVRFIKGLSQLLRHYPDGRTAYEIYTEVDTHRPEHPLIVEYLLHRSETDRLPPPKKLSHMLLKMVDQNFCGSKLVMATADYVDRGRRFMIEDTTPQNVSDSEYQFDPLPAALAPKKAF